MSFRIFRLLAGMAVAAAVLCAAGSAEAQSASKTPAKAQTRKSYCHPEIGYCFQYPAAWLMLGQAYEGNGVVVAPQQTGERQFWDAVTVALVVSAPEGDEEGVSLDETIAQAVKGVRATGQTFETLQRQQRTVHDMPAQIVKVQYTDKADGREWTEELAFLQGPDEEIYSVALKAMPASVAKLEPMFQQVLESFHLQPAAGESSPAAKPKPTPPAQKTPVKPVAPKS